MAVVLTAVLVGVLIGLLARPFVDSYLSWKSADMYARLETGVTSSDANDVHIKRRAR